MKKKENDEIRITPDALISLVVTEAEERELASMPSLKEMNAQFHPSEQFQKKMDRLLKKAHRKEGWVQIWKPTKKVLIAFTSVMTALTFALLPVQAFQDAVVDTLIQWRDGFMNIVYSQETDRQHFDIASKINLSCILTGFTLTDEETSNQGRYIAEFTSDSGGWYTVRVVDIGSEQEVGIDNELTRYYELEFDGNHAIWGIREDNSNVLVWEADGLSFTIYGNPNISELIKVAEGITVDSTLK